MNSREKSLELLFVSKVRIKALKYFLLNPTTQIHLRAAVRQFDEEINAVRRELMRFEKMGLLKVESKGNKKYFKLNLDHPFINELLGIVHKSSGLGEEIIKNAKDLGNIDFAVLTPSYTKSVYTSSLVIDLAIVGVVDLNKLQSIIRKYEDKMGKEIHFTVLSPSEFQIRKRRKDDFIVNLVQQDLIMLIGKHEELIRQGTLNV
jgi:DNA-binding transcriptional ArsR family regulator